MGENEAKAAEQAKSAYLSILGFNLAFLGIVTALADNNTKTNVTRTAILACSSISFVLFLVAFFFADSAWSGSQSSNQKAFERPYRHGRYAFSMGMVMLAVEPFLLLTHFLRVSIASSYVILAILVYCWYRKKS